MDSFNAAVDITALGITFSTVGVKFESRNEDDVSLDGEEFDDDCDNDDESGDDCESGDDG